MKLHEKVTVVLRFDGSDKRSVRGEVVYVHPLLRYYVVEIPGRPPLNAPFRECFFCQETEYDKK